MPYRSGFKRELPLPEQNCVTDVTAADPYGLLEAFPRRGNLMIGTILLIVLVLLLVGALPSWGHSRNWGYGPSGGLGLVVVILLVLVLMGRI